jgi:DNA-binding XRE family transcriptional regulator
MARIRLANTDAFLQQKLNDREFRKHYEIEQAKVVLAQKIAEMRQKKHLNQKLLAEKLGVSQQFISQIETGQGRNLTLDTIIRVADSLGHRVRISFPKALGSSNAGLEVA